MAVAHGAPMNIMNPQIPLTVPASFSAASPQPKNQPSMTLSQTIRRDFCSAKSAPGNSFKHKCQATLASVTISWSLFVSFFRHVGCPKARFMLCCATSYHGTGWATCFAPWPWEHGSSPHELMKLMKDTEGWSILQWIPGQSWSIMVNQHHHQSETEVTPITPMTPMTTAQSAVLSWQPCGPCGLTIYNSAAAICGPWFRGM